MDSALIVTIAVLMGLAAALYSMVGHGGASAYLAIMALFAVAPDVMRPTALALNLIAAGIASIRYARAGQVNWRLLALFVVVAASAAKKLACSHSTSIGSGVSKQLPAISAPRQWWEQVD